MLTIIGELMKTIMMLVLVLSITIPACKSGNDSNAEKRADTPAPEAEAQLEQEREIERVQDSIRKHAEKNIESFKSKFLVEGDEFRDLKFYTHKTFGKFWPRRSTLTAGANSNGYVWLRSNWYGTDLDHNMIRVKVGEEILVSGVVRSFEDDYRQEYSDGNWFEVITYKNCQELLQFIADNYDKEIKVRYEGDKYYKDKVLLKKDALAIRETIELGKMIKTLKVR
jgi:hypothetical protein